MGSDSVIWRDDTRSIEELVQIALTEKEEDARWDAIAVLQLFRPVSEVYEIARRLAVGETSTERSSGADILGQLGYHGGERPFGAQSVELLLDVLSREEDVDVVYSIVCALGHLHDDRAIEPLVRLADHPDADVRSGVAWALIWYNGDLRVVNALIKLSADVSDDTRNWATFGLGDLGEVDIPEVREALFSRLEDTFDEVRAQCVLGLAKFGERRALQPLIRELEAASRADTYWTQLAEAAQYLPDERLLPALITLREQGFDDEDLEQAIGFNRVPDPEDVGDEPDDAPTTCPICGLKEAYSGPERYEVCLRCGWMQSPQQLAEPDSDRWQNPRSLNAERARWRERVERSKGH